MRKNFTWKNPLYKKSDGESVRHFCKKTGVIYTTVLRNIRKFGSIDKACEIALTNRNKKTGATKYWVGELSLYQYCKKNNLSYNKYLKEYRKNEKIT